MLELILIMRSNLQFDDVDNYFVNLFRNTKLSIVYVLLCCMIILNRFLLTS